jgi:hypothetical protein
MTDELTAAEYNEYLKTGMLPDEAVKKKPHKYKAEPATIDDITFASQAEARRYIELKWLKQHGKIRDLRLQKRYQIRVNGVLVTTYVADFVYIDLERDQEIVEDVKGFVTPVYKLKRKLMKVVHGIEIQEIPA